MKIHSVKCNNALKGKVVFLTMAVFICSIAVTGCGIGGDGNFRKTNLSIDKNGKITSTMYEPFDKDYYDLNELMDMALSEASYYNSEYDTPRISVEKAKIIDDDRLGEVIMTFESSSDYSHYNQADLFYGTVQEAMDNGYELASDLVDKNGNVIELGNGDFLDKHIVITSEKTVLYTPYKIVYYTNGVELTDKKEADLTNVTTDLVQILLSK